MQDRLGLVFLFESELFGSFNFQLQFFLFCELLFFVYQILNIEARFLLLSNFLLIQLVLHVKFFGQFDNIDLPVRTHCAFVERLPQIV